MLRVKNVWPMLQLSITSVNRVKSTTPIDYKTVALSLKTVTATASTDLLHTIFRSDMQQLPPLPHPFGKGRESRGYLYSPFAEG